MQQPTRPKAPAELSVLLLDDEPEILDILIDLLKVIGITDIEVRGDGQKGMELLADWRPQVILTDLNMPNVDGYQFAALARELYGKEPVVIVAVSACVSPLHRKQHSGAALFDDYVRKPFEDDAVWRVMRRAKDMLGLPSD